MFSVNSVLTCLVALLFVTVIGMGAAFWFFDARGGFYTYFWNRRRRHEEHRRRAARNRRNEVFTIIFVPL